MPESRRLAPAGWLPTGVVSLTKSQQFANDAAGELVFENTRFEARLDTARFFSAPLNRTTITVDDFSASPAMLGIDGSVDARAEEVTRYLKESPLINTIGGFTRFVALDGPGKLQLSLKIPLGEYDHTRFKTRIAGKYAFSRGHAKLTFTDQGFRDDLEQQTGTRPSWARTVSASSAIWAKVKVSRGCLPERPLQR